MKSIGTIAFISLALTQEAISKDFGVIGNVIPIKENNIIEVIRNRAEAFSQDNKDLIQNKIRQHYQSKLRNPLSVDVLETKFYSVHYYDPTITVNEAIKDHEGNVIIEKGSRYNPLSSDSLTNDLLFFDGSNLDQIEWAKSFSGTWILVKGRPLELEESERRAVFFDQGGILCKKFGIKSVPSRISQESLLLKIESIPKGERL